MDQRRPTPLAVGLSLLLLAASSVPAPAASIAVDAVADDLDQGPNGNCTLREAVMAANTNAAVDACVSGEAFPVTDQIWVPAGTYVLTIPGTDERLGLTGDLNVTDPLQIFGPGPESTIIDADGIDRVLEIRNIPGSGVDVPVLLSGITLRGGSGTGASVYGDGGAIRGGGSSLTLVNCHIEDSTSPNYGGGIYYSGGVLTLQDSVVSGNSAWKGGGIYTLRETQIIRTRVVDNEGIEKGGGIMIGGSPFNTTPITLSEATISDNRGSGLSSSAQTHVAVGQNTTISGNSGWGIKIGGGTLVLENSTVSGNGLYSIYSTGSLTLRNSTIVGDIGQAQSTLVVGNTLIVGACTPALWTIIVSQGGNIESPGDTCRLIDPTDQANVPDPGIEALASETGGPATHALTEVSPAVDAGLATPCPATDERGYLRLDGQCDVGAYELDAVPACSDADGDGYGNPPLASCTYPELDCDDDDAAVNPGAAEIPNNGLDDDCNPDTPTGCNAMP